MSPAIALTGVTKSFGSKSAVCDLDLAIPRGALYGFIGPNGAGKTTTIRMILSILFPDRGDIRVLGHATALAAKDRIGYMPEERGVYKKMKVGAYLRYIGNLKGVRGRDLGARVLGWLERVGLSDVAGKRCEELSKGMQQKVQFVATVLAEPDLLVLDEPFSGLDPVNMRLLRDLIQEQHQRGATVLFSTHVMAQAEEICQHVVMINEGRKVIDAPIGEIRRRHDPRSIVFEPLHRDANLERVREISGFRELVPSGPAWELRLESGTDPVRSLRELVEFIAVTKVELSRPSLEDIFIEIVAGSSVTGDAARLREALSSAPKNGGRS
jgi:ABC-2 type transport system ATP-binding protein